MKAVTQLKTPYNTSMSENMLASGRLRQPGQILRASVRRCHATCARRDQGINQLQQVEIIEIAKCNLDRIPPSLEEHRPQKQKTSSML